MLWFVTVLLCYDLHIPGISGGDRASVCLQGHSQTGSKHHSAGESNHNLSGWSWQAEYHRLDSGECEYYTSKQLHSWMIIKGVQGLAQG